MWRPARTMVARAYGKAFTEEEIRDVYSAAWTATLAALRNRGSSMSDEEVRSYILTAVASHASKEMRRRARKPAGSLDDAQEGAISDGAQLLPEEQVIGNETGGVARDLLASLPPRRRAVMLLRYGWGLRPQEVCSLVSGLSARAYRKEVTRGVAELIERLRQVESGEWCESREPMIRDYVAGTADEEVHLQVREHLRHCRGCSSLASSLRSHLHEIGAVGALLASTGVVAGSGHDPASLPDRILSAWQGFRAGLAEKVEQAAVAVGNVTSSGGFRGSGAAGAGVLAKLAGIGGTGKAGLACLGLTAAAGACVATGVVPDPSLRGVLPETRKETTADGGGLRPGSRLDAGPAPAVTLGRGDMPTSLMSSAEGAEEAGSPPAEPAEDPAPEPVEEAEPAPAPVPTAATEFDPVAASPTTPAPAPAPSPPASGASDGSSGGGGSVAGEEFGP